TKTKFVALQEPKRRLSLLRASTVLTTGPLQAQVRSLWKQKQLLDSTGGQTAFALPQKQAKRAASNLFSCKHLFDTPAL
ncbi:hypothetical protein COEREDRAFT_79576, partial [Coemansia reversa NRRL 1564]